MKAAEVRAAEGPKPPRLRPADGDEEADGDMPIAYKSEEHRQKISEAIRNRWKDPAYRENMLQRMRDPELQRRRLEKYYKSKYGDGGPPQAQQQNPATRKPRRPREPARASSNASTSGASAEDLERAAKKRELYEKVRVRPPIFVAAAPAL